MQNITAIIPARYGSTRFPGKPLAMIEGKTLIEWTYTNTKKCLVFDKVIVATDDKRIFEAVKAFGGEACMTSSEHHSGTDRTAEASRILGLPDDGIVVNVQGDEPLIASEAVSALIAPLIEDPSLKMSTLIYKIRDPKEINSPNIVKVVSDKNGYALYFSRSLIPYSENTGDANYYKHIGLYAYKNSFLMDFTKMEPAQLEKREKLEQLRALENGIKIRVVESDFDPVEVDVPEDIEKVIKRIKLTGG